MRIYFDACCLNRPFDDQTQPRVRWETDAVAEIIEWIEAGSHDLISSDVLEVETTRSPHETFKTEIQGVLRLAVYHVQTQKRETERARALVLMGFTDFDALHLACAESAKADVLLTTDDKFLRRAVRRRNELRVRVVNPCEWVKELKQ